MRNIASAFALVSVLCFIPEIAIAQAQVRPVNSSRSGKFMDGLIRDLRDSYINLGNTPLQPVPPATAQSAQSRELGNALRQFSGLAAKLVTALQFEERYSPNIRILLADAINVQARASYMAQQSSRYSSPEQMGTEFAELNRTWRLLAHQIRQTPNIGSNVVRQVDSLNQLSQQLEQLTKTEPQFQRRDLSHHFVILGAELQHLVEDLGYERHQQDQSQLVSSTRNLASRVYQLQMASDRGYPYSEIVRYFQAFHSKWLPVKHELRKVDNRHFQNTVDRIADQNGHLHELLLLDPVIDGRDILYMAETLKTNVDTVCDSISLMRLISIPEAVPVFGRLQEFYLLCNEFRETVATESNLENVRWDFRELDVSWNEVKTTIAPLVTQESARQVAFIDKDVSELRDALGLQPTADHSQAVKLAAEISNMSDLLAYDINRYIGQSRNYPSQFRNTITSSASSFRSEARSVYDTVARRNDPPSIRQRAQQLAQTWRQLESQLAKVQANDRAELMRTVQHIAPAITKLQVMFGY